MFVVLYILFHLLSIITRTCVWCKGYKRKTTDYNKPVVKRIYSIKTP
nr:MAG TPA: hypothetical protein [Herelleviridae sp.]